MATLILLRHGQSLWNQEKTFTGWSDVGLSERGKREAMAVGRLFASERLLIDVAYCSLLGRAVETLQLALQESGFKDIPVHYSWRLNERHYGALQGLSFWEGVRRFGLATVLRCQRRYGVRPPLLSAGDAAVIADPRYRDLRHEDIPLGESLHDTWLRLRPFWTDTIAPELRAGRNVMVVSHRNALRSLIKQLLGISDSKAAGIKVPTATPLLYEMDAQLRVASHRLLRRDAHEQEIVSAQLSDGAR